MERQFQIDGVMYFAEEARVAEPLHVGFEDHGLVAVLLRLEGPGWGQGFQFGFPAKFRGSLGMAMFVQLALQRFKKGWVGYVLRTERGGVIEGLRDFDINGGEVVLRDALRKAFYALPVGSDPKETP